MESIRHVIGSLTDANPTNDIELEQLQLGQLMSRITNVLSLQCIIDELVTQVLIYLYYIYYIISNISLYYYIILYILYIFQGESIK